MFLWASWTGKGLRWYGSFCRNLSPFHSKIYFDWNIHTFKMSCYIYRFIKCDHSYFKMLSFSRVSHIINIDTWGLRYLWLLDWEWLNWLSGADWSDWLEMIGVSSLVVCYSVKWSISILLSYSRFYHDEEFLISFLYWYLGLLYLWFYMGWVTNIYAEI